MKRRRLIPMLLLLVVLGGAIVNVAVAWGCICWSRMTLAEVGTVQALKWQVPAPEGWPEEPSWVGRDMTFGVDEFSAHWFDERNVWPREQPASQWVLYGGWPHPSLRIERHRVLPRTGSHPSLNMASASQGTWHDGLTIPRWLPGCERAQSGVSGLPLCPEWPGFAINTVFYAGLLWLLFAAPFALRRRRRIRRGLCPTCAYDLRGAANESTTCPECGAAVTSRADAA